MNNEKEILDRIINASEKNTLTFFVGAGVSRISGAPTWSELINKFCKELNIPPKSEYSNDELLKIPQKYYYSIEQNDEKYYAFLEECISSNFEPNIIHRLMCNLKPQSFITTNFDDLIEKSTLQSCLSYKPVACKEDIANINGDKFILKLHGDLLHKNIVLKEEDYLNYSENFKLSETLLKSIFATNTVVFIGYGLNDYNIKLILNWTKTLLAEGFNKPILIYTDNNELDNLELLYQNSRGISVLDFRSFIEADDYTKFDFEVRYEIVLQKIISHSSSSIRGKDKYALFNNLYTLLKPLNQLNVIKSIDISRQLYNNVLAIGNKITPIFSDATKLFKYFFELNKDNSLLESISEEDKKKYYVILEVLSKARICKYSGLHDYYELQNANYTFADSACISFDYTKMRKLTKNNNKSIYNSYKNAFYLAKLRRFKESFELYDIVTTKAYKEKKYLLFYFSQINKLIVYRAMKSLVNYKFEFDESKLQHLESSLNENIFENLPVEFKKEYRIYSDLYSASSLHKDVYESFLEAQRIEKAIEKNTIELGMTKSDIAIYHINNNLHFYLGNFLLVDEFDEFKFSIKNLMSAIIYKISVQNNIQFSEKLFPFEPELIQLDEIDFFCFIEYFTDEEIDELMYKHSIGEVKFNNIEAIEKYIKNLFSYYDKHLSKSDNAFEVEYYFQGKMKTCLKLLRYIAVSSATIIFVCKVLLKHGLWQISIYDKVRFIDSQLCAKRIQVKETRKMVETALNRYIDLHIEATKEGRKFALYSLSSESYWDLTYFLSCNNDMYLSKGLSERVIKIIEEDIKINPVVMLSCYKNINKRAKKILVNFIRKEIKTKFDFEYICFLIGNQLKVSTNEILELKSFLWSEVDNESNEQNIVVIYPNKELYNQLAAVGYWCLCGLIDLKLFSEFVGVCNEFDFFYQYDKFDFNKFDIGWFMNLHNKMYEKIASNETVKEKIRKCIYSTLKAENISKGDKERLTNILIEYFA